MTLILSVLSPVSRHYIQTSGQGHKEMTVHVNLFFSFLTTVLTKTLSRIPHNRVAFIYFWQELVYMTVLGFKAVGEVR